MRFEDIYECVEPGHMLSWEVDAVWCRMPKANMGDIGWVKSPALVTHKFITTEQRKVICIIDAAGKSYVMPNDVITASGFYMRVIRPTDTNC